MIRILPLLGLAFNVWMLVDAYKRRVPYFWYFVIFFVPFGSLVYFFMIKIHDFNLGKAFQREPSLDELRYKYKTTPSLENQITLARALTDAGNFDEAAAEYDRILERYRDNEDALYCAGYCQVEAGNYDAADTHLSKLIEIHPGYLDYQVWPLLARALWEGGKREASLELLRRLNKLNPRIDLRLILAECLVRSDQLAEARELLEIALEDHEHSPAYARRRYGAEAEKMKRLLKEISR